jgi:hypothetical protein
VEEEQRNSSSFHLMWRCVLGGFIFGIFAVIFFLFAQTDRRDKVYSSLLGSGLNSLLTLVLMKYGYLPG